MAVTGQNKTGPTPKDATPAKVRGIFGENLRTLCQELGSVSDVCRRLGVNRTQFNRYLSGESFPRPDVLKRLCDFFGVDARILLEPVENLAPVQGGVLAHPEITDFVNTGAKHLSEAAFPSGIYRFSRRGFMLPDRFVLGLVRVYRKDDQVFVRGYEVREAMQMQGAPVTQQSREFRGVAITQEGGIAILISRRDSMTCSFNFLTRVPSFQHNYWLGYVVRTVGETAAGQRATRLVYEHLGQDWPEIMRTARMAGFCSEAQLLPFHRAHLKIDEPFS